jgi:TRAP-type mannitol/chloroaromatic compound transport system permease small subunit
VEAPRGASVVFNDAATSMPNLNFILPLWLYWAGLLIFPLIAMYLVARQRRHPRPPGPSLFVGYLFWLTAGFLGTHRFYLRSAWGLIFIPVFLGVLFTNSVSRDVRDDDSRTFAALQHAQTVFDTTRAPQADATPDDVAAYKQQQADLGKLKGEYAEAKGVYDRSKDHGRWAAWLLFAMLLVDAALLPGLVRRRRAVELANPDVEVAHAEPPAVNAIGTGEDPTLRVHTRFTDAIEWVNVRIGEYVAYWAVIAVFVYYYEVLARYVFNSPTNWVHESMFLMFGMQYLLSGAYAYKEDQHVRVDVLYAKLSARGKAVCDIITSVFFFIFIGALLWTGIRFAYDAIRFDEHSFTEWGVQYWPIKLTIPIGAALILLQGIAKLVKDILIVTRRGA